MSCQLMCVIMPLHILQSSKACHLMCYHFSMQCEKTVISYVESQYTLPANIPQIFSPGISMYSP